MDFKVPKVFKGPRIFLGPLAFFSLGPVSQEADLAAVKADFLTVYVY